MTANSVNRFEKNQQTKRVKLSLFGMQPHGPTTRLHLSFLSVYTSVS